MIDDRQVHKDAVDQEATPETQDLRSKQNQNHVIRTVNGRAVTYHEQFTIGWKFPAVIQMNCGSELTIPTLEDMPGASVKCPCPDPYCYFIEFR
jgi:hypothetical protein